MIKIKDFKLDGNWAEVTWVEESIQTSEEGVKTTTETQIHCESFSGHPEHIAMLRAKALEYGTELDETLIKECIANFKMPTAEEIAEQELKAKLGEAQALLDSTQFKFGDDYDQKDTPEWLALKVKRQEARDFIRSNDVPNP